MTSSNCSISLSCKLAGTSFLRKLACGLISAPRARTLIQEVPWEGRANRLLPERWTARLTLSWWCLRRRCGTPLRTRSPSHYNNHQRNLLTDAAPDFNRQNQPALAVWWKNPELRASVPSMTSQGAFCYTWQAHEMSIVTCHFHKWTQYSPSCGIICVGK